MTDEQRINVDERLADFTDRLMTGEAPDMPAASGSDRELENLQNTTAQIRDLLQSPRPDAGLRNSIRARLASEWRQSGPQSRGGLNWFSSRKRNQAFMLRFAALGSILVILAVLFTRNIDSLLPGAAENGGGAIILIGGAVLLVLGIIFFWPSRKS